VWRPLCREDGSVVYNCCCSSPAQSFSGPSPTALMTIFYCLRFEIPSTWRVRSPYLYPPGTAWTSYTPRHWVPSSSPTTSRRATVQVFEPALVGRVNFCRPSPTRPFFVPGPAGLMTMFYSFMALGIAQFQPTSFGRSVKLLKVFASFALLQSPRDP
jgi:hypothetical protein